MKVMTTTLREASSSAQRMGEWDQVLQKLQKMRAEDLCKLLEMVPHLWPRTAPLATGVPPPRKTAKGNAFPQMKGNTQTSKSNALSIVYLRP